VPTIFVSRLATMLPSLLEKIYNFLFSLIFLIYNSNCYNLGLAFPQTQILIATFAHPVPYY
ncbi:MAG: hypothetical protein WAM22_09000, partial [Nitrososphaeraceae archaeon]